MRRKNVKYYVGLARTIKPLLEGGRVLTYGVEMLWKIEPIDSTCTYVFISLPFILHSRDARWDLRLAA